VISTKEFDRERAFKNAELLIQHGMKLIKRSFEENTRAVDVPVNVDHAIGMLIRNLLILSIFIYIKPNEVHIDYLDILFTEDSKAFMKSFLCPCGGTLLNYCLHWLYLRVKNESAEHAWLYDAYTCFEYAVKGRKVLDRKQSVQGAGCGTI
jgi:hypothetical protein